MRTSQAELFSASDYLVDIFSSGSFEPGISYRHTSRLVSPEIVAFFAEYRVCRYRVCRYRVCRYRVCIYGVCIYGVWSLHLANFVETEFVYGAI